MYSMFEKSLIMGNGSELLLAHHLIEIKTYLSSVNQICLPLIVILVKTVNNENLFPIERTFKQLYCVMFNNWTITMSAFG